MFEAMVELLEYPPAAFIFVMLVLVLSYLFLEYFVKQ